MRKYISLNTPEQEKAFLGSMTAEEKERFTHQLEDRIAAMKADRDRQLAEKPNT